MIDLMQNFLTQLQEMPLWVQIWVTWLGLINTLSVAFLFSRSRTEIRWTLLAWIVAFTTLMAIFALQGQEMSRLMGLGHIIAWTPLVIYLWRRRGEIYLTYSSGVYLHLLFLTNLISLMFDYVDFVRFFLGHGY